MNLLRRLFGGSSQSPTTTDPKTSANSERRFVEVQCPACKLGRAVFPDDPNRLNCMCGAVLALDRATGTVRIAQAAGRAAPTTVKSPPAAPSRSREKMQSSSTQEQPRTITAPGIKGSSKTADTSAKPDHEAELAFVVGVAVAAGSTTLRTASGPVLVSDLSDKQILEKLQRLQNSHFQAQALGRRDSIRQLIDNLIPKLAFVQPEDSVRIFGAHKSIKDTPLRILRACGNAEDLHSDLNALLEDYSVHVDDHYSVAVDPDNSLASVAVHNKGSANGRVMNIFVWREATLYRFIGQRGFYTDSTGLTVRPPRPSATIQPGVGAQPQPSAAAPPSYLGPSAPVPVQNPRTVVPEQESPGASPAPAPREKVVRDWLTSEEFDVFLEGDLEKVRKLLSSDPDLVFLRDSRMIQRTPLLLAAQCGNAAVFEMLLAKGAAVDARCKSGSTALHYASWNDGAGAFRIARLLLAQGADVNAKEEENGSTPLHVAAVGNCACMVELLLANGAAVKAKNAKGRTPLHNASEPGAAKALLAGGADVNAMDNDGLTPLHRAAQEGWPRVVELLLASGAELNAKAKDGTTPLYWAAKNARPPQDKKPRYSSDAPSWQRCTEIRDLLRERGGLGDFESDDEKVYAAAAAQIQVAAATGDLDKLAELLGRYPELVSSTANENGQTPLHAAAGAGQRGAVELLMALKAQINAKDNDGGTPLQHAAGRGRRDVAELLLASGADVNAASGSGSTPLHSATWHDHKDLVALLLANKAEVNAKTNKGETALHSAALLARDLVELLLANGADIDAKRNDTGHTPLTKAVDKGDKSLVELLCRYGKDDGAGVQMSRGARAAAHADAIRLARADLEQKKQKQATVLRGLPNRIKDPATYQQVFRFLTAAEREIADGRPVTEAENRLRSLEAQTHQVCDPTPEASL
jgi:ankyrin repeat protein/ribosomal protein S27E